MNTRAVLNGDLLDIEQIPHLLTAGAMYGRGIFTTIAIYGGVPFLWKKHWRRLSLNAETVGIDLDGYSEDLIAEKLIELLAANQITDGRARITFFDETASRVWTRDAAPVTAFVIVTGELRIVPAELSLTFSPFPVNSRSPLAGVKSCNYLEPLLASEDASEAGFDEAVRVNERGEITSACMANIFWVQNGQVFTPSLITGCLRGTTREYVLDNIDVREAEVQAVDLARAESIFLTSAGIGIVPSASIDGRRLGELPPAVRDLLAKKHESTR